jgi:hypothetical protein
LIIDFHLTKIADGDFSLPLSSEENCKQSEEAGGRGGKSTRGNIHLRFSYFSWHGQVYSRYDEQK